MDRGSDANMAGPDELQPDEPDTGAVDGGVADADERMARLRHDLAVANDFRSFGDEPGLGDG